jgi:hypothetical protein
MSRHFVLFLEISHVINKRYSRVRMHVRLRGMRELSLRGTDLVVTLSEKHPYTGMYE